MFLKLFLAAFCFIGVHSQLITMELKNISVSIYTDGIVPCKYTTTIEGNPTIRWYRVDAQGQRHRLYIFRKGHNESTSIDAGVTRNLDIGKDGELIFRNATFEDNAKFNTLVCEVDFGSPGSNQGRLNFLVYQAAQKAPTVNLNGNLFELSDTEMAVGTCLSDFGSPQPEVIFYRGSTPVTPEPDNGTNKIENVATGAFSAFVTTKTINPGPNKYLTSVEDILNIKLSKADDQAPFYCIVKSGDPENPKIQNVTFPPFRVAYPTDKVTITAKPMEILENTQVTLTCAANGYPAATIQIFEGQQSNTLQVDVKRTDNEKTYTCSAGNTNTPIIGTYTMMVKYMDDPMISGESSVKLGSNIALDCTATSNQVVMYRWLKGTEVIGDKAMLMVDGVGFGDSAKYTCEASTALGSMGEAMVDVTVNGMESVMTNTQQDGKFAILSCDVKSHPAPKFVWSRDGSNEAITTANLTTMGMKYTSSLRVGPLDSTFKDAKYICTVSNGPSNQMKSEQLGLEDMKTYPNTEQTEIESEGTPIAGVIIGILVALLVIAIIIAVLYNKGIICKSGEKGDENAEDIAVEINKDGDDVENGRKPQDESAPEEEKLVNGDN